jgi:hypothetical protein
MVEHFSVDGKRAGVATWLNKDNESTQSFDILVTMDDSGRSLMIEVKGTASSSPRLTASQVETALKYRTQYVVVVVAPALNSVDGMRISEVIRDPVGKWLAGTLRCEWLLATGGLKY